MYTEVLPRPDIPQPVWARGAQAHPQAPVSASTGAVYVAHMYLGA